MAGGYPEVFLFEARTPELACHEEVTMRSSHRLAAAAAATGLLALLLLSPAAAAEGPPGQGAGSWTLRGFGAWLDTNVETETFGSIDNFAPAPEGSFSLGNGDGAGLALEYRITRRFGIEALAIFADIEGEFRIVFIEPPIPEQVVTKDVETDLYGLGVNVHLTPGRRIDVYLGPVVALVQYGDFRALTDCGDPISLCTFEARFSDDTALGVTLGADVALGRSGRWAATGALRQLWSNPDEQEDKRKVDLDPLIASAGVAYRWGGR